MPDSIGLFPPRSVDRRRLRDPTKGYTPTMTRDQIVAAALRLVDRDGLEALSIRNLASELGVGAMSLCYHVEDKSALCDLVLDAILGEIDLSIADADAPAAERIERMIRAYRTALLEHPYAASLVAQRSSEYHDDRIGPDPAEFPNLMSVFSSTPGPDWDTDFDAGLAALADRLVGCRPSGGTAPRYE